MSQLFYVIVACVVAFFFFPVSIVEWAKQKSAERCCDWKSVFPAKKAKAEDFVISKAKKQD
jgi:hypothetical protein